MSVLLCFINPMLGIRYGPGIPRINAVCATFFNNPMLGNRYGPGVIPFQGATKTTPSPGSWYLTHRDILLKKPVENPVRIEHQREFEIL